MSVELTNEVAQAIRVHDGDHTRGAGELAEIALIAAAQFFRRKADGSTLVERILHLHVADQLDPES